MSAGNLCCIKRYYVDTKFHCPHPDYKKVIEVLLCYHLKMAKVQYNLSQENKGSTPRAAHNPNLPDSMAIQSWFYGPNCSWKNKVMKLRGTYYCTKITRALFYLKRMTRRRAPVRETATSFLQTKKSRKGMWLANIVRLTIWSEISIPTLFTRWEVSQISRRNSWRPSQLLGNKKGIQMRTHQRAMITQMKDMVVYKCLLSVRTQYQQHHQHDLYTTSPTWIYPILRSYTSEQ